MLSLYLLAWLQVLLNYNNALVIKKLQMVDPVPKHKEYLAKQILYLFRKWKQKFQNKKIVYDIVQEWEVFILCAKKINSTSHLNRGDVFVSSKNDINNISYALMTGHDNLTVFSSVCLRPVKMTLNKYFTQNKIDKNEYYEVYRVSERNIKENCRYVNLMCWIAWFSYECPLSMIKNYDISTTNDHWSYCLD